MAKSKVPAPEQERPEDQEREGRLGQVWADKLNQGAKYIIVKEEGGKGTPYGTLYTLFAPSRSFYPRAFTVTQWALEMYYRHQPNTSYVDLLGKAGVSTQSLPFQ